VVVRVPETFADGAALHDVRAAIQAAWLADEDRTAIEIAQRYALHGKLCLRCASWETRWTLCRACAVFEWRHYQHNVSAYRCQVRAFQVQWNHQHPYDAPIPTDGVPGPQTLMRGWRPYRDYELWAELEIV
jgi:hypothetical protein